MRADTKIADFTKILEKRITKTTKNIRILVSKKCEFLKSNERSEAKISNFSDKIEIYYSHLKARKVGVKNTCIRNAKA
jgi:hypothetical protein